MLPSFLRFVTKYQMDRSYRKFRQIFIPIIKERRKDYTAGQAGLTDFMPFILSVVDDDDRASDLVTISVWIGLRNLQIVVASTLLDIITTPGLARKSDSRRQRQQLLSWIPSAKTRARTRLGLFSAAACLNPSGFVVPSQALLVSYVPRNHLL